MPTADLPSTRALAGRIRAAAHGPQWHGPSLVELLRDVTADEATRRPIPGAHGIWEIALHVATWAEIATRRLRGEALDYPSADVDWPAPPTPPTEAAWNEARARVVAAHDALAAAVRALEGTALGADVPGQGEANRHRVVDMLDGVVSHGAYHGGQVALLKRALR